MESASEKMSRLFEKYVQAFLERTGIGFEGKRRIIGDYWGFRPDQKHPVAGEEASRVGRVRMTTVVERCRRGNKRLFSKETEVCYHPVGTNEA
jgi:hypothetical protein